jgi:hypothetical protein
VVMAGPCGLNDSLNHEFSAELGRYSDGALGFAKCLLEW